VAPGTYTDVNEFELAPGWTLEAVVIMKPGVTLLGRPDAPETVVIQAADGVLGIYFQDVDSTAAVVGFTMTGGRSGFAGRVASPTIRHCRIVANGEATDGISGGGMWGDFFSPTIADCVFADNLATHGGGASFANESFPRLERCTFSGNRARSSPSSIGSGGALVVTQDSYARLTDCTFSENAADSTGGAVWVYEAQVHLEGCSLVQNTSGGDGGAVYLHYRGAMTLNQVTVTGNAAGAQGGGFMLRQDAGLLAGDCHLTGNTAPSGPDGFLDDAVEDILVFLSCCEVDPESWVGESVIIDDSDCD
jgi:hypothetical protein